MFIYLLALIALSKNGGFGGFCLEVNVYAFVHGVPREHLRRREVFALSRVPDEIFPSERNIFGLFAAFLVFFCSTF